MDELHAVRQALALDPAATEKQILAAVAILFGDLAQASPPSPDGDALTENPDPPVVALRRPAPTFATLTHAQRRRAVELGYTPETLAAAKASPAAAAAMRTTLAKCRRAGVSLSELRDRRARIVIRRVK